ncbi:unnamed protein product [Caenorhabditis angaria]|uniref:SCP domain-containing protein n=1 Tax=Caenorhabditis angaria TaxID=860376 RepID=A0A9P1IRH3_9PELO|nr:unnamed protein product [Caenorhabditis angaria]
MLKLLALLSIFATVCSIKFNLGAQNAIVNRHNSLRTRIANGILDINGVQHGPASNIRLLRWNNTLARTAEIHANSKPTGHSKGAINGEYGENLWWATKSSPILNPHNSGATACEAWQSELTKHGWPTNLYSKNIARATQMAWAETDQIGCGAAVYKEGKVYKIAIVCQYTPKGNLPGMAVYKKGPTGKDCKFKIVQGLCTKM